uniref:NADP-dependent oxidoreductase domain-containing protein n=1 Tax=Globodera rostochiensis TaxID=31243 RepID=A0A914H228_GLORO
MHEEGRLRAIGVSNFNVLHLEQLLKGGWARVAPAVNQCEFHPHWVQPELISFCTRHGIHFQAYSSLGSESNRKVLFQDDKIRAMAAKYDCSVPDFLLGWALSQGMSVLPRSQSREHIRANFIGASKVRVSAEDIEAVKAANRSKYCWDPEGVQ